MAKKIILVKKWGMFPVGHVFENPSLADITAICHIHKFGKLVGDDYTLDRLKRIDETPDKLLAEAKEQEQGITHEGEISQREKDIWKEQNEKEKKRVAALEGKETGLDDIEEDFNDKTATAEREYIEAPGVGRIGYVQKDPKVKPKAKPKAKGRAKPGKKTAAKKRKPAKRKK